MAKIAIVLTEGFADWEYGLIGGAGGPFYGIDVQYFAPESGPLRSQGGLSAIVSRTLGEISDWQPDVVVIIGGTIWETEGAPDISGLLGGLRDSGASIGAICGGTLALARAGLLNDVAHTSNELEFLKRNAAAYQGEAAYRESPTAIASEKVITAPGTAPASFAAAVFDAAGLPGEAVAQFKTMMAAEHH